MTTLFQTAIILLLLNNFALLSVDRISRLIKLTAFQGAVLCMVILLMPNSELGSAHVLLLAGAVFAIKALGLPWLLNRTMRRISGLPAASARLGHSVYVVAGMVILAFSLWLEMRLPGTPGIFPSLLFPAAMTTLFCGLLLVVGRTLAIAQVIGYLVAENGIFLLGIPMILEGSIWFELSLLLDVFVAVFVMGIAINHIHSTFESIDVGRFCALKD